MNDPIISPFLIYLIDAVDSLGVFFFMLSATTAMFGAGFLVTSLDAVCESNFGVRRFAKKLLVISLCTSLLTAFLPNSRTIYKMIAASYITPANIQATGELTDKAIDKVVDKIAEAIHKFERGEKK